MRSVPANAVVRGPAGSAGIAAGSAGAVRAGAEILAAGGSAVDAALACTLASAVTEPVLSSLGGGGFLLHAPEGGEVSVLDFFVTVPGREGAGTAPAVSTVVVDFAKAGPAATVSEQVFHGGWGTVAVPGSLAGVLEAHRRWGRLSLAEVVAPASALARGGVQLSSVQRRFVTLVAELLLLTDESRALFTEVETTGRYANPAYADLLDALGRGEITAQTDAAYADPLLAASVQCGGLLTARDLADFEPLLRAPAVVGRDGWRVVTNPPPAAGGTIVLDALSRIPLPPKESGRVDWASAVAAQADAVLTHRAPGQVPTGTTHVSVIDADGTVAALTTSNGSGSGTVVPGWGVALNNMLGEEDLQPGEPLAPGDRMGSMMAPTLLERPDGARVVLGTGGSERIRSATLGVVARIVDEGAEVEQAVAAPRVHVGSDHQVHVEPGLTAPDLDGLVALTRARGWPEPELWPTRNVYFGGVHAVRRGADGAITAVGDGRRGGAAAVLHPDGRVVLVDSDPHAS
jgi:gamma-glutamyltranspeptidase/glutathione hydrolase